MARNCEFSTYTRGRYRCAIKGKIDGHSDDVVSDRTYKDYCYDEYYQKKCPFFEQYEKQGSSGCYLTSACVITKGLSDDCRELQTLRQFRDTWLKEYSEGEKDIKEYYDIAPSIVSKINAIPNSKDIYNAIYKDIILPCVELIENGQKLEAYKLYKNSVIQLKHSYLSGC